MEDPHRPSPLDRIGTDSGDLPQNWRSEHPYQNPLEKSLPLVRVALPKYVMTALIYSRPTFSVLACQHLLINTKHKVQLRLMGMLYIFQVFGHKPKHWDNEKSKS